jgi:hypothetical protein
VALAAWSLPPGLTLSLIWSRTDASLKKAPLIGSQATPPAGATTVDEWATARAQPLPE